MRARVNNIELGWKKSFENTLASYKRRKAKGVLYVTRFEWAGKVPIDEAIRRFEGKLARMPK